MQYILLVSFASKYVFPFSVHSLSNIKTDLPNSVIFNEDCFVMDKIYQILKNVSPDIWFLLVQISV